MRRILTNLRWRAATMRTPLPIQTGGQRPDVRDTWQAAILQLSARAVRAGLEPGCLLGDICRTAARLLDADHVQVAEFLPDGCTVIGRAAAGWSPEQLAQWHMEVPVASRVAQLSRTGGLLVLDRRREAASGAEAELLDALQMSCGVAAGLSTGGDGGGLFGVYSARPRAFDRDELQVVRTLARIAESALQRETGRTTDRQAHATESAAQADLLRLVVARLRPALRDSVGYLWQFRSQPPDSFGFRRAVRQTERKVANVAGFIEDLSLLAELLEGRAPARGRVVLAPVLMSLVDQLSDRARSNGLALQLDPGDELMAIAGEATLLRRALFNLIDNALRFTGAGGSVHIGVTSPEPGWALVQIADTGRGMTTAQIERLSRNREGAIRSEHRGPGMGWRLSAAIVQAFGGVLTATSDGPDLGSRILVRLPRLDGPGAEIPDPVD